MRQFVAAGRERGLTIGLVPTMGALHDGHAALLRRARGENGCVVATIFVNPIQFDRPDDLEKYPRTLDADIALCERLSVDAVFAPDANEMYPAPIVTSVAVAGLSTRLEGQFRPGHFAGVATVVAKLLSQAAPDVALFGEKDFQQLLVIRRVVRDCDIPVRIEALPTVREPDGLALSSRNAYLSADERARAPLLHRVLRDVARGFVGGDAAAPERGIAALLAGGFAKVDYLAVRDAETLAAPRPSNPARVLAAAWLGRTRLIDNVPLAP